MHAFKEADMSYLEDLSGGDQSLIIEMLRLFLSQTPGYLDSLSRHIDLGDWSNTQSMAHHIKPTLAYMGAEDMRQALIRIEQMAKADPVDSVVLRREFSVLRGRFEVLFKELEGHLGFLTSKM
ncbi:MAG TPA: Hpt domain-containing protein [Sphingobacteriaceae bacterium]|nr:Hpt domain-containing protein [Sphingobacteriaceae bacterium]